MSKKISELTEAVRANNDDLIMIVQNGENKKIKASKLSSLPGSSDVEFEGGYTFTGEYVDGKKVYAKYKDILLPLEANTWSLAQNLSIDSSKYATEILELNVWIYNANNNTERLSVSECGITFKADMSGKALYVKVNNDTYTSTNFYYGRMFIKIISNEKKED